MEILTIVNLGPIKQVRLENIQPLLVIVGESGSGKSTILKVLSMCRWIFKQQNIRCYLHNAGISRSPFSHNVNIYLNTSGLLDFVKPNTRIVFERSGVTINIVGKGYHVAAMEVTEPTVEQLCLEKVCFVTEKRNTLPDLLATRTTEKFAGYYTRQLFENFKIAQKHIQELNLSAVDVRLKLEKKNGNEMWMIENNNMQRDDFSIHLEDASSGIQSAVPLEMLLTYFTRFYDLNSAMNNAVVRYLANADALKDFRPSLNIGEIRIKCVDMLIEEPEMCLFPDNQFRLLNRLVSAITEDGLSYQLRLAFTTHSPYLLNDLNLLFLAYDKNLTIEGANLDYNKTDVYAVENGELRNLKVKNAHLINPEYLSAPLDNIYNQFEQIEAQHYAEDIN